MFPLMFIAKLSEIPELFKLSLHGSHNWGSKKAKRFALSSELVVLCRCIGATGLQGAVSIADSNDLGSIDNAVIALGRLR